MHQSASKGPESDIFIIDFPNNWQTFMASCLMSLLIIHTHTQLGVMKSQRLMQRKIATSIKTVTKVNYV